MCALYSFPLRRIRRLPQLNSDKTWKRIFDGKLSEEFTVPSQYKEIVIQITIAYQGASDITLPEIYINDLVHGGIRLHLIDITILTTLAF
jgi:hypothetical protein